MRPLYETMDRQTEQEEKRRRGTCDFLELVGSKRRVKVYEEDTEYHYIETRQELNASRSRRKRTSA